MMMYDELTKFGDQDQSARKIPMWAVPMGIYIQVGIKNLSPVTYNKFLVA